MKRVSFKVAKALKEAGYPQEGCGEYLNKYGAIDGYLGHNVARPYVMEVWLWLWREKKIRICLEDANDSKVPEVERGCYVGTNQLGGMCSSQEFADPEDAIVDIIEHFVKNDLIH